MKFISTLVTALAWPLSAFFIVNLFRSEIIERIPKLSELTLPGGISAKFNAGLAKVEAAAETSQAEPIEARIEQVEGDDVMVADGVVSDAVTASVASAQNDEIALRANPTGVVMETWKSLEQVLRLCAAEIAGLDAAKLPSRHLTMSLRNKGFITHEDELSLLELVELRNLVAHDPNKTVSDVEAKRFALVAERFKGKLLAKIARHRLKTMRQASASNVNK